MTQDIKPNSIHFQTGEPPKCIMRIEPDRIWVDPDVEITEAAALVLQALEANIKRLVEAEREACAKVADGELMNTNMLTSYPPKSSAAWNIAAAIRARG